MGAHPSLDDRDHFGRRELTVSNDELKHLIRGQVTALDRIARTHGTRVRHVKPHGALYNMAARTPAIAAVIADTLVELNPALTLVGLSGSELIKAGRAAGLTTMSEVFADRAYLADGSLAPRGLNGAVLSDARAIAERAVAMVEQQQVEAIDGTPVRLTVETICLHSDTPGAVDIARRVREALAAAGVHVSARR